ncbi:hypothetical protein ACHAXT_003758 [Thalassiosira profunda]
MMLVPLTAADAASTATAAVVGGKASSLAKLYSIPSLRGHVPKSYALATNFFQPWADRLATSEHARAIRDILQQGGCSGGDKRGGALVVACEAIKQQCLTIPLSAAQELTLQELSRTIANEFSHGLAAVRSSATEEDGAEHSFAGQFETRLGVAPSQLEEAVRECFASKFDVRVVRYMATHGDGDGDASEALAGGFALVVMEMVDAAVAGVSFSANPINSDRDECVVDSSYGLGESVVDGSVTADRFIYDKVHNKLIDETIGTKKVERRLKLVEGGGVQTLPIDDEDRQNACSLSDEQLQELVRLTTIVEKEYGTPMDVEWAYDQNNKLVLLQARPITTLFFLDDNMMTAPGERRMLYYDMNIASEATTTTPFRHMDMTLYCRLANIFMGMDENEVIFGKDPMMPMFCASTRQYINLSIFFKFVSPKTCAKEAELLDPYLASLFASKDCNRKKYRMKRLPKGVNVRNLWYFVRKAPLWQWYQIGKRAKNHPERAKEDYLKMLAEDMAKLDELKRRGYRKKEGLQKYSSELIHCFWPSRSLDQDCGIIYAVVLGLFRSLDKKRREGKTEQVRSEYDALCGGYEGDELMEMNIALYRLANTLSSSVWDQYDHDQLHLLAERVQMNLEGTMEDLPSDFLSEWTTFMDRYGFDGDDQLFISPPRYSDNPAMLLARLRQNAGAHLKDPAVALEQKISERRRVMKLQEDRLAAKRFRKSFALKRMKQRNQCLEHLMRIRNAPKLHMSKVYGVLRENVLQVEADLMKANRLEAKDDIFHCDLGEVDRALADESFDLMAIVRPRKEVYERALRANECPMLIDSRCRILRPDPPSREDVEEGTLIGAAVSPGVASGRVRIMKSPTDHFESGEVLAATVTSPAWTPLFVGAAAVILQIGGVLQHGALCAREYGKPAVSNIDIHNDLQTGMEVRVDGNKGTVEVLSEGSLGLL